MTKATIAANAVARAPIQLAMIDQNSIMSVLHFGIVDPVCKETKLQKFGGRTRARTRDPLIKSQLLYQLSYALIPAFRVRRRKEGHPGAQPLSCSRFGPSARRSAFAS
jgi:hypothetical protein